MKKFQSNKKILFSIMGLMMIGSQSQGTGMVISNDTISVGGVAPVIVGGQSFSGAQIPSHSRSSVVMGNRKTTKGATMMGTLHMSPSKTPPPVPPRTPRSDMGPGVPPPVPPRTTLPVGESAGSSSPEKLQKDKLSCQYILNKLVRYEQYFKSYSSAFRGKDRSLKDMEKYRTFKRLFAQIKKNILKKSAGRFAGMKGSVLMISSSPAQLESYTIKSKMNLNKPCYSNLEEYKAISAQLKGLIPEKGKIKDALNQMRNATGQSVVR